MRGTMRYLALILLLSSGCVPNLSSIWPDTTPIEVAGPVWLLFSVSRAVCRRPHCPGAAT